MDGIVGNDQIAERGDFKVFRRAEKLNILIHERITGGAPYGLLLGIGDSIELVAESRAGIVNIVPDSPRNRDWGCDFPKLQIRGFKERSVVHRCSSISCR